MKFGICTRYNYCLENYPTDADYIEIAAFDLCGKPDDALVEFYARVRSGEFKTYSCNALFPSDLRLTGDVDRGKVVAYCDEMLEKLDGLGIKMLVFGSGWAKHVPDGFSRERAWEQLYDLGDILSDTASRFGQTVVVEPLRYAEVNIINTVDEAARYVRTVNRDNFKLLADLYHYSSNGEPVESIIDNKDILHHYHLATLEKRSYPTCEAEWKPFADAFRMLKSIGYCGNISFEGGCHPADIMNSMLGRMRELWDEV
ncbi:MAG: sugar phosphate isomerase/epimerase [Clostridia bacterium]|nr:sugar phosphate isomerase/epimerase [Clostridia bacterium]